MTGWVEAALALIAAGSNRFDPARLSFDWTDPLLDCGPGTQN